MSSSNCCFLTCIQVSQETGKLIRYSHLISRVCCGPQRQGLWHSQENRSRFFLELSCFFDDPVDVGNLILVPVPFLNPAWTSGSSRFMCCWRLAWRILSITLLASEMSTIVQEGEHSLACLFLGLEWKLTFSNPVATAEFSKCVGILSAAFSQHHLSGFEIAQLEFHHLH